MFRPKSNLDASAQFEKSLAERLASIVPPVDLTRVDLTPFLRLRAKVDCISISYPCGITKVELDELVALMAGRLELPRDNRGSSFITIHDPTLHDLRYIIAHFPEAHIDHFEVAVDAHLPAGSNDIFLLRQLKAQLRHCIAPQSHDQFKSIERRYFDLVLERWVLDATVHAAPLTTVDYIDHKSGCRLKIYIKTIDHNKPVGQSYLRTELTLSGVAPSWAGMDRVEDIPKFAKRLRKYCASAFTIGRGFKRGDPGGERWKKSGAAWAINPRRGLAVQPDAAVNRAFGDALSDLGRSLMRL
jgi:hypothetical protein